MIGLTSYVKWFCSGAKATLFGEIVAIDGEYAVIHGDDHKMYRVHHERLVTAQTK